MASKKGVVMYYDILEQLEDFSDEQFGKMTRAIIKYDKTGEITEFDDPTLKVAFKILKPTLDRNKQEYQEKCEKNRQNVLKRWEKEDTNEYDGIQSYNSNTNDTDKDIDKEKDNDIEKDIFLYWNSKGIIEHKKINNDIHKSIEKALKTYTVDEIKTYIDRYKTVIDDKSFFFDYKWKLNEFLSRKEGISAFADDGSKWNSYLSQRKPKNIIQEKNAEYMKKYAGRLVRDDTELF